MEYQEAIAGVKDILRGVGVLVLRGWVIMMDGWL